MAVLEALAMGVPCLVTPGTNMADEIAAAEAGWAVEPTAAGIAAGPAPGPRRRRRLAPPPQRQRPPAGRRPLRLARDRRPQRRTLPPLCRLSGRIIAVPRGLSQFSRREMTCPLENRLIRRENGIVPFGVGDRHIFRPSGVSSGNGESGRKMSQSPACGHSCEKMSRGGRHSVGGADARPTSDDDDRPRTACTAGA